MDHHDIIDNIASGLYKVINKKGRSDIWTTFGEVQREDGHILLNLVCCRLCKGLFKFNGKQTSNLIRHKCHVNKKDVFKSLTENAGKAKTKTREAHTESDDEEEFKWSNDDDGGIVSDANVSKQMVTLKAYPLKRHLLLDEEEFKWSNEPDEPVPLQWRKEPSPPPSPANKKTPANDKNEDLLADHSEQSQDSKDEASVHRRISKNIDRGIYKIVPRKNGRSVIWAVFGEIQGEDGKVLKNLVYCRLCKRILKFNGMQTSNLNRHGCYANTKDDFISLNGSAQKAKPKSSSQELPAQSEDDEECKWENDDDDDSNISNANEGKQNLPLQVNTRNSSKRQSDYEKEFQWSNDDDDPLQVQKEFSPPPPAKKTKTLPPANILNEPMFVVSHEVATSQVNVVDNYEKGKDSKDEACVYADGWAFTYRKLSTPQQIFAKQAIDEILSRARIEGLKFNYLGSYHPDLDTTNDPHNSNTK